jgi:IclR family transcriptional regulator, pca regulon regulatory protein
MAIKENDPDYVTALVRGLSVIRCFDRGFESLTLSEVAARTALHRGTARRFLLTLEAIGYISQNGRKFRLSPKVLDLGYAYLSSVPLWEQAQPFMKEIVDQVDESCSIAVLNGTDVVYLARLPPRHLHTVPVHVGTRMPAYVNSMGRVLLAELDEPALAEYFRHAERPKLNRYTVTSEAVLRRILQDTRRNGYSLMEHELHEGRRSMAVPIRNRDNAAVASINLSALMSRATKKDFLERFLPMLHKAASTIGKAI